MKLRAKLIGAASVLLVCAVLVVVANSTRHGDSIPISLADANSEDAVERCLVRIAIENGSLEVRTIAAPHERMGHLRLFTERNTVALFMGTTAVIDVTGCIVAAGLKDHIDSISAYDG
ncbi:TPA: hypothetical protein QDZ62_000113 [Stenotrophomonas maltophilia]|nr:hypothetical protein [Stenotrophomonas maltophilia]